MLLRQSPNSESLLARISAGNDQKVSVGARRQPISVDGVRSEIPARYRHFRELTVRYARWDLGRIDLVDGAQWDCTSAPIYPSDKAANADGRRAAIESAGMPARLSSPMSAAPQTQESRRTTGELLLLLKQILHGVLGHRHATGLSAWKTSPEDTGDRS